jgi:phage shock protein C
MIAGVCGGIAERYGWSPSFVRLLFVLSCILPGTQVLVYIVMWVFVPKAGHSKAVRGPYAHHGS